MRGEYNPYPSTYPRSLGSSSSRNLNLLTDPPALSSSLYLFLFFCFSFFFCFFVCWKPCTQNKPLLVFFFKKKEDGEAEGNHPFPASILFLFLFSTHSKAIWNSTIKQVVLHHRGGVSFQVPYLTLATPPPPLPFSSFFSFVPHHGANFDFSTWLSI